MFSWLCFTTPSTKTKNRRIMSTWNVKTFRSIKYTIIVWFNTDRPIVILLTVVHGQPYSKQNLGPFLVAYCIPSYLHIVFLTEFLHFLSWKNKSNRIKSGNEVTIWYEASANEANPTIICLTNDHSSPITTIQVP